MGDPAERWAQSGGMSLTGRAGGPHLGVPHALPSVLDGLAKHLHQMTAALGRAVDVDGPALLGERAAIAGHGRSGDTSCGGVARLLPAADGWLALSIARTEDVELLPAWLGIVPHRRRWTTRGRPSPARWPPATRARWYAAGAELGLAVARLGERADDRAAVLAGLLADGPPVDELDSRRVVDLSSLWAGPLCGQLLAAAGMDVVKVESRQRPDGARRGPRAFFDLMNGEKASVALDLSAAQDRGVLRRLLLAADVVIEASRPRALRQLGCDAEELVRTGRARVWVSITGHGRQPPHDHRVAFGDDGAVAGGLVARDDQGPGVLRRRGRRPESLACSPRSPWSTALAAGGRWLLDVALARSAALLATGPTLRVVGPGRCRRGRGRRPGGRPRSARTPTALWPASRRPEPLARCPLDLGSGNLTSRRARRPSPTAARSRRRWAGRSTPAARSAGGRCGAAGWRCPRPPGRGRAAPPAARTGRRAGPPPGRRRRPARRRHPGRRRAPRASTRSPRRAISFAALAGQADQVGGRRVGERAELVEVAAARERRPGAGQDDAQRRVGQGQSQRADQLVTHLA